MNTVWEVAQSPANRILLLSCHILKFQKNRTYLNFVPSLFREGTTTRISRLPDSSIYWSDTLILKISKIVLAKIFLRLKVPALFETQRMVRHPSRPNQGNPVKIRDGCATVTGYKLPLPLIAGLGRRERDSMPEVRIPIWLCSSD